VSLDFKHIELTSFTPYAGKFAGYRIRKGKLNLDLRYEVEGKKLKGENKVFLEQFTLGERVDSPDATRLPVRLAIALLKDRNGNIDLDIPVKGNLDDPKFSIGRVILRVFMNLIAKAVMSPFKLLGALAGGGGSETFEAVEFEPGSAALGPDAIAGLGQLSKALADRPALHLEIEQLPDAARDSSALAQKRFEEILAQAMTDDDRRTTTSPLQLPPTAYAALVERAHARRSARSRSRRRRRSAGAEPRRTRPPLRPKRSGSRAWSSSYDSRRW